MSPTANLIISSGIALLVAGIALILNSNELMLFGAMILAAGLVFHLYQVKILAIADYPTSNSYKDDGPVKTVKPDLASLRRAVTEARKASKWFSGISRETSFYHLSAAFAKVSKSYGIPGFEFEAVTQRGLLKLLIDYVECFLPLLEDGQYDAARYAAHSFLED